MSFANLRLRELRDELASRGLDTSGNKPALIQRLEQDEVKKSGSSSVIVGKKMARDGEEDFGDLSALEKLRNMGVRELREEAKERGFSTSGTKKELVERIAADIEEKKENVGSSSVVVGKKRARDAEEGLGDFYAPEKLRNMGVRELREEAKKRELSTSGMKKELMERISADIEEKKENGDEVKDGGMALADGENRYVVANGGLSTIEKLKKMGLKELREQARVRAISEVGTRKELLERIATDIKEEEDNTEGHKIEEVKREKLVTATKKGGVVLDQWLPDHIKASYHVLQRGEEVYDAILNQTNVGDNNNKFYIIQALQSDNSATFMVYNRWGRVGVRGQDNLLGPYMSIESAIDEFQNKFLSKTKNHWSERKNFKSYPKCYTWLEMDYNETENLAVDNKPKKSLDSTQLRESQLDPRVAEFISLICNIGMMRQQMLEIGYNADKLPLGKLSKSTILKGYDVLRRISDVIGQSNQKELEILSGEFYTVIPHDFGFKKMREFVINTPYKLKCKLEMVEALGEIEIATQLLRNDMDELDDPLYSHYRHLNCVLVPVEVDSSEFSMIKKYLLNTHAKTHSNYSVAIAQVFKVSRNCEEEHFRKFAGTTNRMLLWHGSRLTNWTGILSQGLRIAPPEAPVTGYMFGKGVYFADMFSKSANYCYATSQSRSGVLLLCEVALGDMAEMLAADYNANCLPDGKLSTKGVGATEPDSSEYLSLNDGVVVPLGKPKERSDPKGNLLYNEYIVYNIEQIRMRYIVQVHFNFK